MSNATLYRHHERADGTFGLIVSNWPKFTTVPSETWGDPNVIVEPQEPFACLSLELPWRDNAVDVHDWRKASCVPLGVYAVTWQRSPAFRRELYRLRGVEGRTGILIHPANTCDELRGCIAVGDELYEFTTFEKNDDEPNLAWGVTSSSYTLDALHTQFYSDDGDPGPFTLEIKAYRGDAMTGEAKHRLTLLESHYRNHGGMMCADVYGCMGPV